MKLLKMNFINEKGFDIMKPTGYFLSNLYGLPKVHKPNNPLQPILSMCG